MLYIRNRPPAEAAWRGLAIGRKQFPMATFAGR
jgi:uncharacterized protein (DUF849 family)